MTTNRMKAPANAISGARRAGRTTLCASPCHSTPFSPDWASAAPTRPPIRACEELEGSPNHQVSRFQAMAPSRAARMVRVLIRSEATMSLPTVCATAVVTNAPARFATDATSTAIRGVSARVETEVATALAVSWNPFVKSKPSATTITTTRRRLFISAEAPLAVLDENRLEDVGRVLAGIDGLFELLVYVLPADHADGILAGGEELRHGVSVEAVTFVLPSAESVQLAGRVLEAFEPGHCFVPRSGERRGGEECRSRWGR